MTLRSEPHFNPKSFELVGHDNPTGQYPALVVPVGKLADRLVIVYSSLSSNLPEVFPIEEGQEYVHHDESLNAKLQEFDFRNHELFAVSERDVQSFETAVRPNFLGSVLRSRIAAAIPPFYRLSLSIDIAAPDLVSDALVSCVEGMKQHAPEFFDEWKKRTQHELNAVPKLSEAVYAHTQTQFDVDSARRSKIAAALLVLSPFQSPVRSSAGLLQTRGSGTGRASERIVAPRDIERSQGEYREITSITLTMKELLEAGVHFGYQTKRWNPKMKDYIFGERNGVHIFDLQKTLKLFKDASRFVTNLCAEGKTILFVGTKTQAQDVVVEEASRCGMPYINNRWLGGLLTNWVTVQKSVKRLHEIDEMASDGRYELLTKKEVIHLERKRKHLQTNLAGIKNMRRLPDALFIIDSSNEAIAAREANKLGIPVVAVVNTNCDPTVVDYVIPGNNNGVRAIRLFTSKIADRVVEGLNMEGDKVFEEEGRAVAAVDELAEVVPVEEVDLEAALGRGIRRADVALAGFDEAEAEETGHF